MPRRSREERAASLETELRMLMIDTLDIVARRKRRVAVTQKMANELEEAPLQTVAAWLEMLQCEAERRAKVAPQQAPSLTQVNIGMGEAFLASVRAANEARAIEHKKDDG
jgi:cytochrome c553